MKKYFKSHGHYDLTKGVIRRFWKKPLYKITDQIFCFGSNLVTPTTTPTPTPMQPVNCVVGTWGAWSTCDADCGGGTQTQYRDVIVQPANGGTACPVLSQSRACNTQPCP
jgi:hypothetical protein